ncbi:MAG: ribosomal-protein-alanine N-acetyltransferase [candidate division Zixibacteria bacterium 4484_95]|nr:MAG: ribosomal-protein-alanine N-acetyltransferase [candidate division Zixibacteria bacterium 4484_95]RKX19263.1 MAG: ribosomal-protein-alanine N-acetyltransferase [candidate division Zixibacteria bacterium]
MDIKITRMTGEDVDEIHRIESKVFSEPWSKMAFLSDISNDFAIPLVARFEKKIAGYACLYKAVNEIQIGNLAVSPDFHQRGIGTKIMDYIIDLAAKQKVKVLILEVRQSNEAARKLYLKFGFRVAGKRKYYYHKPREDALIMIREVD